jgi:hypothetical protein
MHKLTTPVCASTPIRPNPTRYQAVSPSTATRPPSAPRQADRPLPPLLHLPHGPLVQPLLCPRICQPDGQDHDPRADGSDVEEPEVGGQAGQAAAGHGNHW